MKLIVEGNLAGWAQFGLIGLGFAMMYFGLSLGWLPRAVAITMIVLGLPIAAIGGYASRAKALGLKPFDNSYKKARASYNVNGKRQDGPK